MDIEGLISELNFRAVRSSGSGGQHVNKVSSKVELMFDLNSSQFLSEEQKTILIKSLTKKLTKSNTIILRCDETRSQHLNKELVIKRFVKLIKKGLKVRKKRVPTKTPKKAVQKRLDEKRKMSEKKESRQKPDLD